MQGGAIYAESFKSISINEDTLFQNNFAYQGYGQNVYATKGSDLFYMENVNLYSYVNSVYLSSTKIIIKNTNFFGDDNSISKIGRSNGGGINIQNTLDAQISNCEFRELTAKYGGAIYYREATENMVEALDQRNRKISPGLVIRQITTDDCLALQDGGSVYLADVIKAKIESSTFENSKATYNGGGIYFWCEPTTVAFQKKNGVNCALSLSSNTFRNATAVSGGGIWWNFVEP